MTMTPPRPLPPGAAPVSAADCVAVLEAMVARARDELADYPSGDTRWRARKKAEIAALESAIRALVAWLVQSTAKDVFFSEEAAKRYAAAIGADAIPLYAGTPSPKGPTTP
jgi:hypothetical protein